MTGFAAPRAEATMLLSAALVYGMVAQGAFYAHQAMLLAGLSIAATWFARGRPPRLAWWAFGVLAAGIALSWALVPDGDPRIAVSVLVIAGSATLVGAAHRSVFRSLAGLLLLVGTVEALVGIIGAAWHLEPIALEAQGIWRAASLVTYANSLGAVLVPCLAAGAWRLREQATLLDRLGVAAITAGLVASLSRAAAVSLLVGLVVAVVADRRGTMRAVAACRTALVAGAIGGLGAIPAIFGDPAPVPAIAALVVAALLCLPATGSGLGRIVLAIGLVGSIAAGIGALATDRVDGVAERMLNEDRARIWRASARTGIDELPLGQGLERFEVYEQRVRRVLKIRYAHNEGLQAFVETGVIGPIAYAAALALFGVALWSRRHGNGLELGVAAAFLTHGMLDFVWHVPVVALLAFLFVGAALARPEELDAAAQGAGGEPTPSAASQS